jgi:hypothetical protein
LSSMGSFLFLDHPFLLFLNYTAFKLLRDSAGNKRMKDSWEGNTEWYEVGTIEGGYRT